MGDLIARLPIGRKRGSIEDKIFKLLVYGDKQIPGPQIRISKIRTDFGEFAQQQKEGDRRRRIT